MADEPKDTSYSPDGVTTKVQDTETVTTYTPGALYTTTAPQEEKKSFDSYTDVYEYLDKKSAAERERQEKKEKRNRLMASLGEGISALSNLWFTHQYAPNMYDPSKGMNEVMRQRYEKLRKEREERDRAYNAGLLNMIKMDEDRRRNNLTWKRQLEQWEWQKEQAQKAEERAAALHQLDIQLKNGQLDKQAYDIEKAKIEAEYAPQYQEAKIATEEARRDSYRAQGNSYGRKDPLEYIAYDRNGKPYRFKTEEAARYFAKQEGTWQSVEETTVKNTTTTDTPAYGNPTTKETEESTVRVNGGYSVNPKDKKDEEITDYTPGGTQNGGVKNWDGSTKM